MKDDKVNMNKDMEALGLNLKTSQGFYNEEKMKNILKSERYSQRSALASIYGYNKKIPKEITLDNEILKDNVKYVHSNMVQSFNDYDRVKNSRLMLEHIMVYFI